MRVLFCRLTLKINFKEGSRYNDFTPCTLGSVLAFAVLAANTQSRSDS